MHLCPVDHVLMCATGYASASCSWGTRAKPVESVGCDKRQRRHTMSVIRCACALLVTPYSLRIVNIWPTLATQQ